MMAWIWIRRAILVAFIAVYLWFAIINMDWGWALVATFWTWMAFRRWPRATA